jgi:antitoxin component YwqK of YwqJK toxin-antitoxin module
MKNKKRVDTTFFYDMLGTCYGYKLNQSDTDRVYYYKDGHRKIYYSDGHVNCSGVVTDHHQGDQWNVYYKSGKLSSEKKLKNGVGYITEYFKNGNKKAIIFCDESQPEDLYVQEWYENGQLEFTSQLKSGRYDGFCKRFFENSQLKKYWEMREGIHHGVSKEYYENGQVKDSCWITNDLKQGNATVWYENGEMKATMHYRDDKVDGLQKGYYENGTLLCEANMREGKPDGETRRYNALGKLESIELYSNGRRIK